MRLQNSYRGVYRHLASADKLDRLAPKYRSRGSKYYAIGEEGTSLNLFHRKSDPAPKTQLYPGHILKVLGKVGSASKVVAYAKQDLKGWVFGKLKALPIEMKLPREHRKALQVKQVKGLPFVGDIDRDQFRQGYLGNCYFIASLMAVAHHNPSFIREMITPAQTEGSYNVRLFDLESGQDETFEVDLLFPFFGGRLAYGHPSGSMGLGSHLTNYSMWLPLVEKAYAKKLGDYEKFHKGGFSSDALKILTGKKTHLAKFSFFDMQKNRHSLSLARSALGRGRPVVLESLPESEDPCRHPEILSQHAYILVAIDDKGAVVADPLNPVENRMKMSLEQVSQSFFGAVLGNWET